MKKARSWLLVLLVLFFGIAVFRGTLYRFLITYHSLGVRRSEFVLQAPLKKIIDEKIGARNRMEPKEIIELSLSITGDRLRYSFVQSSKDPNVLAVASNAHCVGYAIFYSNVCNYLFKRFGYSKDWEAKVHRGHLFFLSMNLHRYSDTPFFKDHDFVLIENSETKEGIAVDPTLYDVSYIETITYVK